MRCPSDMNYRPDPRYGPCNYVTCVGSGSNGGNRSGTDGVFYVDQHTRIADILDGTSNTALLSETTIGPGGANVTDPSMAKVDLHYGKLSAGPLGPSGCAGASVWNPDRGAIWADGESIVYDHFYAPNATTIDCMASGGYSYRAARSRHPGGVNVLLGDGSVRFVGNAVDFPIWQGLSTRAGGEVLGDH